MFLKKTHFVLLGHYIAHLFCVHVLHTARPSRTSSLGFVFFSRSDTEPCVQHYRRVQQWQCFVCAALERKGAKIGIVCRHPFAVKLLASVTASPLVKTCNFTEPQPFPRSATRRPLSNPAVPYDLFPHHWQHHRFGHACLLPLWMLWSSLKPVLLSLSFFFFFTYISAGLLKVFCVWGTGWRWSVCYRQWVKRGDRSTAIGAASLEWCLAHAMGRANFWAS